MWKSVSGGALALTVLVGCSTTRLVESDVNSYTQWPENRQPGSFSFERLPSQQARPAEQSKLEALATPALQKAGFRLAPGGPGDVTIQVGLSETYYQGAPWDDPYWGSPWGPWGYYGYGGMYHGRRRSAVGVGVAWSAPSPYYVFDAAVLIRDAKTKQVLYESHAKHDGRWADDALRATLFEAALQDFPRPAISPRRVRIELPPDGKAAAEPKAEAAPASAAPAAAGKTAPAGK
ncbi:DUF4136 domain-containing protein [Caldimonas brevitalea]|uniref:DUF4136 domain-containing protein n=1 Tax=Caldimonas brevitalea TaxID=413882 RepID=A0A0G3BD71_9BURK|nr:DUF4136 domain-containing protein [Caldimonas brevitalea]AKJ27262.1 hypothetical protein AAW51_0571 [Caldimonas brevitalea]